MTDILIEELRSRYDKEWDIKDTLEDKAKNVISTAGTITSLIFGFVTLSTAAFKLSITFLLILAIVGSIIASILSIMISILALRLQDYLTTFKLTKLAENQDFFIQAPDQKLALGVVRSYIGCIVHNERTNYEKAKKVQCATYLLFSSIALVGIATALLLSLFQDKAEGPILTILQGAPLENSPFLPNPLKVMKGDTIYVVNRDSLIHTVTSGHSPNDTNVGELYGTGIINPGGLSKILIANLPEGEYPFFCLVHPNMTGVLKVLEPKPISDSQKDPENQLTNGDYINTSPFWNSKSDSTR